MPVSWPSLNAATRARDLDLLTRHGVDLLVVGGGVTGTGIALDAASRGLRVALVERGDLAQGTSRWSSKLVHGGLRYLAHGDIRLARDSARERAILMTRTAPHLIRALPFLIPSTAGGAAVTLGRLGTGAGDFLRVGLPGGRGRLPRARWVGRQRAHDLVPGLRAAARGGVVFWDGQLVDDARLVLGLARTAATYGASILTRMEVTSIGVNGVEPPPYSQRAVADLRRRISWHLGTPDPVPDSDTDPPARPASHVVVAAHSQGSLIALAALLWLPVEERGRVGLVTFGSQLKVQFPRAFPAYVNFSVLTWLYEKFGERWISLYRDTDAIAGPVLSWGHTPDRADGTPASYRLTQWDHPYPDEIDVRTGRRICGPEWRLLDPTPYDVGLQEGAIAKIRGHGDYPLDPDYSAALRAVFPRSDPPSNGPRHTDYGDVTVNVDTTATTPVPAPVTVRRTRTQRVPRTAARDEAGARPQAES